MDISDIRTDLKARIEADAYFADINVYVEEDQDLDVPELEVGCLKTKGGKKGVAVIIQELTAEDSFQEVTFGPLDIPIRLWVVEQVITNRKTGGTGKKALAVARKLVTNLKHYIAWGLAGVMESEKNCIQPLTVDSQMVVLEVRFRTREADYSADLKVETPAISLTNGAVHPSTATLTCGTAGASIYYTTNGTHPWAGNAAATLYTVPFAIATACTLRVAGFKTGLVASDTGAAQIT